MLQIYYMTLVLSVPYYLSTPMHLQNLANAFAKTSAQRCSLVLSVLRLKCFHACTSVSLLSLNIVLENKKFYAMIEGNWSSWIDPFGTPLLVLWFKNNFTYKYNLYNLAKLLIFQIVSFAYKRNHKPDFSNTHKTRFMKNNQFHP